jgi:hypothetical protein
MAAGEDQRAGAAYLEQDQALAGEEGFGAAPLGADLDSLARGDVGAGLNQQRLSLHLVHDDVTRERRREHDLATLGRCVVGVDEEGFAAQDGAGQAFCFPFPYSFL